jgi:hypothetical protein
MRRAFFQICFVAVAICQADAQPPSPTGLPAALFPPLPQSPVAVFRMLLATNELGRTQWITKWKPTQRAYLENKIAEFTNLSPDEREARLQTLQLRWYLPPLMTMDYAERANRLASIPQPERALLESKLRTWDIQPPQIKKDLLDNQQVIGIFMFPGASGASSNVLRGLSLERQDELRRQLEKLNQLPDERRTRTLANFQQYFQLTPAEKNKALDKLTVRERAQMQQTLAPLEILPPSLRQQALMGFRKFAELTPPDRAAFLQSAERWQNMSEAERAKWRRTTAQLQKMRVLIPPPPMPHTAERIQPPTTMLATNSQ